MTVATPLPDLEPVDIHEVRADATLDLILARVRLYARRRNVWLGRLSAEFGPLGNWKEFEALLDDLDNPADEAAWLANDEQAAVWDQELRQIESVLERPDSQFSMLQRLFGLNAVESDLLQTCLGLSVDPSLGEVFAELQPGERRSYVTEYLVARLLGHGRTLPLSSMSPLRRWELVLEQQVAPGEPTLLSCDRTIREWLAGRPVIDPLLVEVASIRQPLPPLSGWPVDELASAVERVLSNEQASGMRVQLSGPPGTGRRTLAAGIAANIGLPLLALDLDRIDDHIWPQVLLRANRHAFLNGCALAWHGDDASRRPWLLPQPAFPIQFVIAEGEPPPAWPGFIDHVFEMPMPTIQERRELWRSALPELDPRVLETLASRHRTPIGGIAAIARQGVASPEAAIAAARTAGRHQLGPLVQPLECPFRWDDLVVTDDIRSALEDIVFEAQERLLFWERPEARRLFPEGRGLLTLFTGPPGTGKTMAAQVIAASLQLDLLRINVSSVVSKYVGETSQNLERIMSRARQLDAVLLFDEADALFARRTEIKDAHDRFANTDTNYLLQAVEQYPGVALLSTNKKANIDPAFFRRLRYVLDFPRPDVAQREQIWTRIVGELAGPEVVAALNGRLTALAASVEATGAQIKFATLASMFIARREGETLGVRHLVRGLERELIKDGRALSARERERLVGDGN
jgi:hypothetical protein